MDADQKKNFVEFLEEVVYHFEEGDGSDDDDIKEEDGADADIKEEDGADDDIMDTSEMGSGSSTIPSAKAQSSTMKSLCSSTMPDESKKKRDLTFWVGEVNKTIKYILSNKILDIDSTGNSDRSLKKLQVEVNNFLNSDIILGEKSPKIKEMLSLLQKVEIYEKKSYTEALISRYFASLIIVKARKAAEDQNFGITNLVTVLQISKSHFYNSLKFYHLITDYDFFVLFLPFSFTTLIKEQEDIRAVLEMARTMNMDFKKATSAAKIIYEGFVKGVISKNFAEDFRGVKFSK